MTDCGCTNFPASLGNVTFGASVGIGTAAPAGALDVGGSGTQVAAFVGPASDDFGTVVLRGGTAGTYWELAKLRSVDTPADGFLLQAVNGSSSLPALMASLTGQVGIGTMTPTAPLCVAGAVGAASTGFAALGAQRWRLQQASGDEANAGCLDYRGFDAGSLSIVGAGATGSPLNRNVRVWDTLTVGYSAPTGAVAAFNGNVGIGTSTPAQPLDVNGNISTNAGVLASGRKVADGNGCYYS